jgi:Bacteriophage CI repressor helix-turn-helix domain
LKTTAERVEYMMKTLKIKEQTEFGKLCGASKSVVYQWLTGRIKSIDAKYAFQLEDNTPFSARWIMLGEGKIKK